MTYKVYKVCVEYSGMCVVEVFADGEDTAKDMAEDKFYNRCNTIDWPLKLNEIEVIDANGPIYE